MSSQATNMPVLEEMASKVLSDILAIQIPREKLRLLILDALIEAQALERQANDLILADMQSDSGAYRRGIRDTIDLFLQKADGYEDMANRLLKTAAKGRQPIDSALVAHRVMTNACAEICEKLLG